MYLKALVILVLSAFWIVSPAVAQERDEANIISANMNASSNKWSSTFFSIASVDNFKPGKNVDNGRSFGSYNYISLNYKRTQDTKLSLRLPFVYESGGADKYGSMVTEHAELQDVHVSYSMYDLGYIGPIDISGAVKVYVPSSENSQAAGMYARFRADLFFDYALTRFSSITYVVKPDIFWQSRTAYFNSNTAMFDDGGYVTDPRSTTKQYSLEHYLEFTGDINKYLSLKLKSGFDEDWMYSSVVEGLEGRQITKAVGGIGLQVRPLRGISFIVGIENKTTLGSYKGQDARFFMPENTSYTLMTNLFLLNL